MPLKWTGVWALTEGRIFAFGLSLGWGAPLADISQHDVHCEFCVGVQVPPSHAFGSDLVVDSTHS